MVPPPETILVVFLLFCRIGGCLMLMPGFSSTRVPVHVRLFIALAISLALTPLLLPTMNTVVPGLSPPQVMRLIFSETLVGLLIGLIGRCFYVALQFMVVAASQFAGFGAPGGTPIEDPEPVPTFATFVTLTATVLLFVTDQHWEILRALIASYTALPIDDPVTSELSLARLADALSSTFLLAVQITSPFIVYALIINLMVGIANKLVPNIPVFFISMPFTLAGGLLLLYFTIGEALRIFSAAFFSWLTTG